MKKHSKLNLSFLFVLVPFVCAYSQTDSLPVELTRQYLSGELKNYKSVQLDEKVNQDYNVKKISKNAVISCEVLLDDNKESVIAASVEDKNQPVDLYFFWVNRNGWKIQSIRTLRLSGIFYIMLENYKNLDDNGLKLQYDKIVSEPQKNDSSMIREEAIESPGSFEEFKLRIKIMKLAASSDKELINHFNSNKPQFDAILNSLVKAYPDNSKTWMLDRTTEYKNTMGDLLISSISNIDNPKIISFEIVKMMRNSVGYFYCKNPNDLPSMEDNHFIMIRNLGNGWYFYKTT